MKLDQENKRNVKIIEDMIIETAKHKVEQEIFTFPPEEYYKELKNTLQFGKTTDRQLSKLIEVKFFESIFICNLITCFSGSLKFYHM